MIIWSFVDMEILSYILASLIGLSLGLIGGGGSILTVPVLVYVASIDPVTSTAYSLFIVGITSLVGVFGKVKAGLVNFRTAILFGIPSIISVYLTRLIIVPSIPDIILSIDSFILTKDLLIMLVFAIVMFVASITMIKERKELKSFSGDPKVIYILAEGVLVGLLTGFVGAGGGFLIIPALVIFLGLEMKKAVGTSLMIISMKSLIGFVGDLQGDIHIDWSFLLIFSLISIVGIFTGNKISKNISSSKLKKSFGYFVLVMAIYIIVKELFI